MKLIKKLLISLMLLAISGCSTYPSRFKCGDAKGLGCLMLSEVDRQISSGQIEEVYSGKNQKCKGGNCFNKNKGIINPSPSLTNLELRRVKIERSNSESADFEDDEYWYF